MAKNETASQQLETWTKYKVIRIYWVWAEGNHEAIKQIVEGEPKPDVEFAVQEQPKGWIGNLMKQLLG
jgi:23S rRNA-/tRNA-specific pseudouridylate synthase